MKGLSEKFSGDYGLQKIIWKIERVGWFVFAAFLALAFIGFTGVGPASEAVSQDERLEIKYSSFARFKAPTELSIKILRNEDETISFWIEHNFLKNYSIEQITPSPTETVLDQEKIYYFFSVREGQVEIQFNLKPNSIGKSMGHLGTGETELNVDQFILP